MMDLVNNINFNLLLSSKDSEVKSIVDIFDTLYCDKDLTATFRIAILYSIFSKENEDINSIYLKLLIKYISNGTMRQNLYREIINDEIGISETKPEILSSANVSENDTITNEVILPKDIHNVKTGRYFINYSTRFPGFGNYQLELYYKIKQDDDFALSAICPLTIKQK